MKAVLQQRINTRHLSGPTSCTFATRFIVWPKPCCVNVAMANRVNNFFRWTILLEEQIEQHLQQQATTNTNDNNDDDDNNNNNNNNNNDDDDDDNDNSGSKTQRSTQRVSIDLTGILKNSLNSFLATSQVSRFVTSKTLITSLATRNAVTARAFS